MLVPYTEALIFFRCQQYDLRNESIKLKETDNQSLKKVKIIVTTIAGNVEVDRR